MYRLPSTGLLLWLCCFTAKGQSALPPIAAPMQQACKLIPSYDQRVLAVNSSDVVCLAQHAANKYTLFFVFGIWCRPCKLHLPNALKLAKEHHLDAYVLLIEEEQDEHTQLAVDYLLGVDKDIKILILKDADYGQGSRNKYERFLKELTPAAFEHIPDMSKYIVLNKAGRVVMVTNWKDNQDHDWQDDSQMIQERIVPVLE